MEPIARYMAPFATDNEDNIIKNNSKQIKTSKQALALFHLLWSQAIESPEYDQSKWMTFLNWLENK